MLILVSMRACIMATIVPMPKVFLCSSEMILSKDVID